ncbi:MAG: hypothetical protein ACI909_000037 [Planctomycetota bacterium]|jgi:hypothetical protein
MIKEENPWTLENKGHKGGGYTLGSLNFWTNNLSGILPKPKIRSLE